MSNVILSGVTFATNSITLTTASSVGGGAAIAVTGGSTLTLSDSVFVGNSARAAGACVGSSACSVAGGAVYADSTSTLLSVVNCTFTGNTATSAGAAAVYGGAVAVLNAAPVLSVVACV